MDQQGYGNDIAVWEDGTCQSAEEIPISIQSNDCDAPVALGQGFSSTIADMTEGLPEEILPHLAGLELMSLQPGSSVVQVSADGKRSTEYVMQQVSVQVQSQKFELEGESSGSAKNRGYNALQAAILYSDDPKIAQDLIDAGYDVNLTSTVSKETALHVALRAKREYQATYADKLLKAGGDIGVQDCNGNTVLHICKQTDLLSKLIKGSDHKVFETRNLNGYTPLHSAIDCGHNEAVDYMLDRNVDPNVADLDGNNALHLASRDELTASSLEWMEWSQQDLDDKWKAVIPHLTMGTGLSKATYKRLLTRMHDIDNQNNAYRTALHIAVEHNCLRAVMLLMEADANAFEIPDADGNTAYDIACSKKDIAPEILGLLGKNVPNQRKIFMDVKDMLQNLETSFMSGVGIDELDKTEFKKASKILVHALKKHKHKYTPMEKEHRGILLGSFDSLLNEVAPGQVLEVLKAEGIFTEGLVAEISEESGRRAQSKKMLDMLMTVGRRAFPIFCKALSLTGQFHALEIMKESVHAGARDAPMPSIPQQGRPMPEEHRKFIRDNRGSLLEKMTLTNGKNFIKSLVSNGVLTKAMFIEVTEDECGNPFQRILDILPYRGRNALPVFCRAMVLSDEDTSDSMSSGGEYDVEL